MATGLLLAVAMVHGAEPVALSGRAMGTTWVVTFAPPHRAIEVEEVRRQVADRLETLENLFSTYRAQSTLSRFNALTHTDWFGVEPELARVAAESRAVSELTGGAFDATVTPLIRLWGFGGAPQIESIPSPAMILAARTAVDWRTVDVHMLPPALRKTTAAVTADFSSMAKGFAADAISELLGELGVADHLVQIGGDVKAKGDSTVHSGWRVGIEEPVEGARAIASILVLKDDALSTSGNYRNHVEIGGRSFGHIIDPRTGEPVSGSLVSVSVVHRDCRMSSALATALFVLGEAEGFRLACEQKFAVLFQVRDGTSLVRRATPEFERRAEFD